MMQSGVWSAHQRELGGTHRLRLIVERLQRIQLQMQKQLVLLDDFLKKELDRLMAKYDPANKIDPDDKKP